MPTEADTCRELAEPKLQAADWDSKPHFITAQGWFVQLQSSTYDQTTLE
jgi:hypothetical protein